MVVDGIRGGGVVAVKRSVGAASVMVEVVGMSSYPSTHRESQLCRQRKRRRTIGLLGQRATQTIGRLWHSSALKVTRVASRSCTRSPCRCVGGRAWWERWWSRWWSP
jgi:hypothetical protein